MPSWFDVIAVSEASKHEIELIRKAFERRTVRACEGGGMIEFLMKVPLFENLSLSELHKVEKIAKEEAQAKNTVMFSEIRAAGAM